MIYSILSLFLLSGYASAKHVKMPDIKVPEPKFKKLTDHLNERHIDTKALHEKSKDRNLRSESRSTMSKDNFITLGLYDDSSCGQHSKNLGVGYLANYCFTEKNFWTGETRSYAYKIDVKEEMMFEMYYHRSNCVGVPHKIEVMYGGEVDDCLYVGDGQYVRYGWETSAPSPPSTTGGSDMGVWVTVRPDNDCSSYDDYAQYYYMSTWDLPTGCQPGEDGGSFMFSSCNPSDHNLDAMYYPYSSSCGGQEFMEQDLLPRCEKVKEDDDDDEYDDGDDDDDDEDDGWALHKYFESLYCIPPASF